MNLPEPFNTTVKSKLNPDEKIQWWAQPTPPQLATELVKALLIGLPLTIIGIIWLKNVFTQHLPQFHYLSVFSALMGLLILYFGLVMVTGYYLNLRNSRRTLYVVTNKRALIFDSRGWFKPQFYAYGPDEIKDLKIVMKDDNQGDILLARKSLNFMSPGRLDVGFFRIKEVQRAEKALKALQS